MIEEHKKILEDIIHASGINRGIKNQTPEGLVVQGVALLLDNMGQPTQTKGTVQTDTPPDPKVPMPEDMSTWHELCSVIHPNTKSTKLHESLRIKLFNVIHQEGQYVGVQKHKAIADAYWLILRLAAVWGIPTFHEYLEQSKFNPFKNRDEKGLESNSRRKRRGH